MAPPPSDLRKIGLEGFALIDKFYGPPRRNSTVNDTFPGRRDRSWVVYHVANDVMEEPSVNNKDTTGHYGVVNYPKGKPQNRWGRPIKFN